MKIKIKHAQTYGMQPNDAQREIDISKHIH